MRLLAILLGIGVISFASGCVTPQRSGFAKSLEVNHDGIPEYPAPIRQKVHLMVMNGADLLDTSDLQEFCSKVVEAGYPKVYFAQKADHAWYERELLRLSQFHPDARIVLLGAGVAADQVLELAAVGAARGVDIDSVILLDPVCAHEAPAPLTSRVIVVRTEQLVVNRKLRMKETVIVSGAVRGHLPKHPGTLDAVVNILQDSAAMVGPLEGDPMPSIGLGEDAQPTPRGTLPEPTRVPDEWDFLRPPPRSGVPAYPDEENPYYTIPKRQQDGKPIENLPLPRPTGPNDR